MSRPFWLGLFFLACAGKIPSHLQLPPVEPNETPSATVQSLTEAIATMLDGDPLARRIRLVAPHQLEALEGGAPLAALSRAIHNLERGEGTAARNLQQLEQRFPDNAVTALSRGYRLSLAEATMAAGARATDDALERLALLITPLAAIDHAEPPPRSPMAWLVDPYDAGAVRRYADRWALGAWLHSPTIDLAPVYAALQAPQFEPLRNTPTARIIEARVTAQEARPGEGLHLLVRATALAAQQASADTNAQQAVWQDQRQSLRDAWQTDDPIAHALRGALDTATPHAGNDASAGIAWFAANALRLVDACEVRPCQGFNRVSNVMAAARWDPQLAPLADAWSAIVLKRALDSLDVGHQTALYPGVAVDLADALLGSGSPQPPLSVVRRSRPDATAWLEWSRTIDDSNATDWASAKRAIEGRLREVATRAHTTIRDEQTRKWMHVIVEGTDP